MGFAVSADYRVKLPECEKKYKYLDLARELKKLGNMKVMIILIVPIGALATVTKGLVQELEDFEISGRVETIQTITLLGPAIILRRVLETREDFLSLKLQWKTISLPRSKMIIIISIDNDNGQTKQTYW